MELPPLCSPSEERCDDNGDDNLETKPGIPDGHGKLPDLSKLKEISLQVRRIECNSAPLDSKNSALSEPTRKHEQLRRPASNSMLGRPRTAAQLYQCDLCHMRFTQVANMRRHKISHFGVRPFECRFCPKRFFRKDHLTEHVVRQHSKQQPFRCPLCDNSFKSKLQLKSHLAEEHSDHTKGRTCKVCGFKAATLRGAKAHFTTCHAKHSFRSSSESAPDQITEINHMSLQSPNNSAVDLNTVSQNFVLPPPCQMQPSPVDVPYPGHPAILPSSYVPFSCDQFNTLPYSLSGTMTNQQLMASEVFQPHSISPLTSVSSSAPFHPNEYKSTHDHSKTAEIVTIKTEPMDAITCKESNSATTTSINYADRTCLQQMLVNAQPLESLPSSSYKEHESVPLMGSEQSTLIVAEEDQPESRPPSVVTIFTEESSPLGNPEDTSSNCMPSETKDIAAVSDKPEAFFGVEQLKHQSCSPSTSHDHSGHLADHLVTDADSRETRRIASSNSSDSLGPAARELSASERKRDSSDSRRRQADRASSPPSYNPPVFTSASTSRILTLHTVSSTENVDTKCVVTQSVERTTRTCHFCNTSFTNQTLYYLHRGMHTHSNPWKCNICGQQCQDMYEFNSHIISDAHF